MSNNILNIILSNLYVAPFISFAIVGMIICKYGHISCRHYYIILTLPAAIADIFILIDGLANVRAFLLYELEMHLFYFEFIIFDIILIKQIMSSGQHKYSTITYGSIINTILLTPLYSLIS